MKHKLVYIEWEDATSTSPGTWYLEQEALQWADNFKNTIQECGFILREDKKYIVLGTRRSPSSNGVQFGGIFRIPKPWITKRKSISL